MEFSYPVTVFTPTYNRAYILGDLYHSLQRQTCMDFEWLIVDDGSADDTKALVASWQGEKNPFPIRSVYQENGGKCRAINRGLKEADGRLFFTVDSDDYLTDDAIEKVIRWEGELPRDGHFCGYVGNRGITPTQTYVLNYGDLASVTMVLTLKEERDESTVEQDSQSRRYLLTAEFSTEEGSDALCRMTLQMYCEIDPNTTTNTSTQTKTLTYRAAWNKDAAVILRQGMMEEETP